jgi:hypothetical protein
MWLSVPAEALRRVYVMLDGVESALREVGLEYVADDLAEVDAAHAKLREIEENAARDRKALMEYAREQIKTEIRRELGELDKLEK